jgi:hypothetical protein
VADLTSNGSLSTGGGLGKIYQIKSLARPSLSFRTTDKTLELTWTHGILQESDSVSGPWNDLPDAASPYSIELDQPRKFYRAKN